MFRHGSFVSSLEFKTVKNLSFISQMK